MVNIQKIGEGEHEDGGRRREEKLQMRHSPSIRPKSQALILHAQFDLGNIYVKEVSQDHC